MHLIGINGFKRAGKDTTFAAIKRLQEQERVIWPEDRVERRAFADNLKISAMLALGWDDWDDELIAAADDFKENGWIKVGYCYEDGSDADEQARLTFRKFLQNYGAKCREVFGEWFWVDQVVPHDVFRLQEVWGSLGRKGKQAGLPAYGCVTDVRYPNEALRIKHVGGVVLEVVRPGIESDGDASEQPLPRDLVDYTIHNDGTIDELILHVQDFLEWLANKEA